MIDKVRENRIRRYASRLGLMLKKSRGRLWNFDNQMEYMLVDINRNFIVAGEKFDLDIDEVETWLKDYEKSLRAGK